MSLFSASSPKRSPITKRTTVGFGAADVAKARSLASNLASNKPFRGKVDDIIPKEKRRTEFLAEGQIIGDRSTGFKGEFSNISTDQVSRLINIFTSRRQEIQRKRSTPGRRQLFLTGS